MVTNENMQQSRDWNIYIYIWMDRGKFDFESWEWIYHNHTVYIVYIEEIY